MKCEQLNTEQLRATAEILPDEVEETNKSEKKKKSEDSPNKTSEYSTISEASASTDISRGGSILAGTVSSSNGVKDVLAKYAFVGLQSAQGLAVGLSSAFIAVDMYQLFNATRNLNNGSMSETAKVLRLKADQLLEQQLFFNQIYE